MVLLYVPRKVWRHITLFHVTAVIYGTSRIAVAQKMASDVFIINLQTDWNIPQKNPKSVSPLDQFITHVIIPANTGQIEALEAGVRPGFKTNAVVVCLFGFFFGTHFCSW